MFLAENNNVSFLIKLQGGTKDLLIRFGILWFSVTIFDAWLPALVMRKFAVNEEIAGSVMAVTQSAVTQDMKGMVWGLGLTLIMIMG